MADYICPYMKNRDKFSTGVKYNKNAEIVSIDKRTVDICLHCPIYPKECVEKQRDDKRRGYSTTPEDEDAPNFGL